MDYKKLTEDLVKWVEDYAKEVGVKGFIFGLSLIHISEPTRPY